MKNIEQFAKQFEGIEHVKREIKRIQSIKCRLKKQKARKDYESEMEKVLKQEQVLKEVRQFLEPRKITVTTMTEEDIKLLDYDETIRAIKSIQSKKCNSQYNSEDLESNIEYQNALKIEEMLKEHRKNIRPIQETVVRKSELNNLIEDLENLEDTVSKEYLLERLNELLEK